MKRPRLDDCKVRPWYLVLYDYEKYMRYLEKVIRNYEEIVDLFPQEKLSVRQSR